MNGHSCLTDNHDITQVQIKCLFIVYVKILVVWVSFLHGFGTKFKFERKVWEISQKKWRHHFSTSEILPEYSPANSRKLTFEANGKTLAPPLYQTSVQDASVTHGPSNAVRHCQETLTYLLGKNVAFIEPAWHVAPKQPGLTSSWLRCLGYHSAV